MTGDHERRKRDYLTKAVHLPRMQVSCLAPHSPRVEYSFRRGQHELLLCLSQLSEDEVVAVREGKAEFGLLIYGLVIFLLYRSAISHRTKSLRSTGISSMIGGWMADSVERFESP